MTKSLTLGILFPTSARAVVVVVVVVVVVAKLVILGISFSSSFILPSREALLVAKLVKSTILSSISLIFALYTSFLNPQR